MLDGVKIVRETWENNTLIPLYDNEESVCGIIYNDVPYYFQKNLQGDIIAIINKDAETVARYTYDAWGLPAIAEDISDCNIATINPYRYRGYYYDAEIGMYYLQSRYYDPVVGRFVCCDIIENITPTQNVTECNLYSYCECDPINNYDDNGAISWNKVLSIFNKIGEVAKSLLEYLIDGASWILGIKNALRPKDISKIANEVKRSPHRVRQCFSWLEERVEKLKSKVGKIFTALSFILFITSIASVLKNVTAFVKEISKKLFNKIAEGLSKLINWGVKNGIKFLAKFVPALGGVVGFLLGEVIGRFIDKLLEAHSTRIANKFASKVNIYKFKLGDYFVTFFKCLA